jgi:hypothetical protein
MLKEEITVTPSCRLNDNIKLDLKEVEWEDEDWINLPQDMDQ